MTRVTVRAHAKINLNLRVLGGRSDGFHAIETVVQTITLHDTLLVSRTDEGIHLEVDDPSIPTDRTNLVWQAAASLAPPVGSMRGVRVQLRKRIPAGSGLGGGSSDAAAAMVAIARLWDTGLGIHDLTATAARLGSDVPYFLTGGTARLTGRGTEVQPLPDLLGYRLVVAHPGPPLSTREVYAGLQATLTPGRKIDSMGEFGRNLPREVEAFVRMGNDLEPPAVRLCPEIGEVKRRLSDAGATVAALTGSGSGVFGVFRGTVPLNRATRSIEDLGWRVFACEPLGRSEFLRDLGLA
jgi:4-diphosphocytidyl-2-C-methyl-D-erythritol kinase